MSSAAKFWDKASKKYALSPVKHQVVYEKKLEITQSYLKPDMEILEIGCGTGTTAFIQAPFVNHIHAIDFSPSMIEICRKKKLDTDISNVTFECQDIFKFQQEGRQYDLIMAHSILHLVDNKNEMIRLVSALLKSEGVFIISTFFLKGFALKPIARIFNKLGIFPLLNFFSKEELLSDLKIFGFEIDYLWEPGKKQATFLVAKKVSQHV